MGTGRGRLQSSQMQKKSQEIHVNTEQTLQKQNSSVLLQKDKNMPESMSAVKSVFQIKSEKIEIQGKGEKNAKSISWNIHREEREVC